MRNILLIKFLFLVFISHSFPQSEARLLRFPDICADKIVFSYAGDLYLVSSNGGTARKITADIGYEMFPRFSNDGKHIAFTGQYDGNTEIYIIPSIGGEPKRLTFTATLERDDVSDRMGPNNITMGWKHNTNEIIFRSRMREFNDFKGQLYLININGNMPEQLPLPYGGFCSFSPDNSKLAFNRVFREFRTWKRYRGGMADDIWIYDFKTKETINITNHPAQDIIPMWVDDKIYFISDRDENKKMNLYSYDLNSKVIRQLTFFSEFDIKFPSNDNSSIVFENAGYIYKFDISSQKYSIVPIFINDDFVTGRNKLIDVSKSIVSYDIAPNGNRALFCARGDIFTVPKEFGTARNITNSSGIHDRSGCWSPDGKWIAYISDHTGEDEIYVISQDGSAPPTQLTNNSTCYKFNIEWSNDSKKILWSDRELQLQYVDIETKKVTIIDKSDFGLIRAYCWSPDNEWIAYVYPEETAILRIKLYSLELQKSFYASDEWFSSFSPSFSSDGKYLFFVSNRDFNPIYSQTEWNHAYRDMSRIYLLTLAKETPSPFKPKSDEVDLSPSLFENKNEKDKNSNKTKIKVDIDGLTNRIIGLPIKPANYNNLQYASGKLYYLRNTFSDSKSQLAFYDIEKLKEIELGSFNSFKISADSKKMMLLSEGNYSIIDLPTSAIKLESKLNLEDLRIVADKKAEWRQIFNESWRQMRDFLYAPNMHGVNWLKIKEQYSQLLPHINCRQDLTYVIGEMVGELNVGHAYVGGGDYPKPQKIKTGLLGAKIIKDSAGYFKIEKILKGQNWTNSRKSPLTEIGIDVKEGDFIIEINGFNALTLNNIYEALFDRAGKQTVLKVNSSPAEKGSKEITIIPIADESPLYYFNWVENNIEKVNKATDGRVGYIHIPDMGANGLNEFVKYFYPQLRKEALIIDVRGNGGGNVSPMLIDRLKREIAMVDMSRNTSPRPDPYEAFLGPKICLIDQFSASDGDLFPYRFKKYGLGKLVGRRTWGGIVGISGSLPFVDGGYLMKPEFTSYDKDGKDWIIEGVGVEPDIFIDNDPALEFSGVDQQLNKAIEEILNELEKHTYKLPPIPPFPDKSK